jgi:hypothetical protein
MDRRILGRPGIALRGVNSIRWLPEHAVVAQSSFASRRTVRRGGASGVGSARWR